MKIQGAGLTDVGGKRDHNEDNFLCDPYAGLFIIADGMGGRVSGETASKVVVTLLPIMLKEIISASECSPNTITLILHETLCKLSADLYQRSQLIPDLHGLGSTAVVLFIRDNMAYIAYTGDSRVYVLRDAALTQVTEDQTTAAALVRAGHMSLEVAVDHPLRHKLEEYIGKEGQLNPGIRCKKLHTGDRWLLCSDGLIKGISDQELQDMLLQPARPEQLCQAMITKAKETDGTDNITAIVVDIIEAPALDTK
jgi:serine/threonine protein phosphatase PrpC